MDTILDQLSPTLARAAGPDAPACGDRPQSVKGRKARQPEARAVFTLREIEQWLALEIAGVYHGSEHRGLRGGTPAGAWAAKPPKPLPIERQRDFRIGFLPGEPRLVRRDGLHFQCIRYWHPVFSAWAPKRMSLFVHYDPRDLSKLYARTKTGDVLEIGYFPAQNHLPATLGA